MKMGQSLFWGLVLIVIGLSIIIKIIFHVEFPIFKILIAFLFVYLGIRILIGGSWHCWGPQRDNHNVIFGEAVFTKFEPGHEYNVIFGKGTFDFRSYRPAGNTPENIKINTVFGNSTIILPDSIATRVNVDAVFSGAQMPNGNATAFGSTSYTSEDVDSLAIQLNIKADVVFSGLQVRK